MARQKSFQSALRWSYAGNWVNRGLSALSTLILAGVLGPRDFGMVAMALIYIGFLQLFLDQGFVAALIQRKNLEFDHLNAVFWLDQALSLALVALSVLLCGWWAARNRTPEIAGIICVLSICIPLEGLATVQTAILKREMNFRSLSIRSNIAELLGGTVGIGMALFGFRVWALVGQQITRDVTALALLWNLSSWRPRLSFSWAHLKSLMSFSIANFIAQLAIFLESRASSLVLGLFVGPIGVGLYLIAERIAGSVLAMATSSIQAVSFPEFARLQDKPQELRTSILACVRLSSMVALPALAGLVAISGPLMATMGSKWVAATDALKILSALGMLTILANFTGPLLQALSKPNQLAVLEWTRVGVGLAVLTLVAVAVKPYSLAIQVAGIATARFVAGLFLITPVFLYILMRLGAISLRNLTLSVAPAAASAASIIAGVELIHFSSWLSASKPMTVLVIETLMGGTIGLTVLLSLDAKLRRSVRRFLRRGFLVPPAC